jgi:hypothetical protein
MSTLNEAYSSISDVNLWLKSRSGDTLLLSDVPTIIPLRWGYFKDTWEFLRQDLVDSISLTPNPDFFKQQIDDFTKFIQAQRNGSKNINPFQDVETFYKFYSVFDNIEIESINLTNEEQRIIESEIIRVSMFSKNDFLKARHNIADYRDRVADTLGLSDADYNKAFNKSSIPPQVNATIVDANYLLVLQNSIKTVDFILANLFAVDSAIDPFALARANANNSEINIGQYSSGSLVRINYGEDLQSLANRYLGDRNKWIDIAIANGLKPPYIDEVGQSILLISNGNGNQINLAETDVNGNLNIDKLYINQPVFLRSNTQTVPDQRVIINITQVPVSGEIVLELDGPKNLSLYQISEGASIRVFAPNTVNSSFYVLIPSPNALPDDRVDEVPWFLAKSAEDEKRAKIDLAIDNKGELIFTTNSDIRLSYGLENAIQAVKLKIITELGSLPYHPDFGLVNIIGQKNANIEELKLTITESITSQIEADSRFDRVESLSVDYLVSDTTNAGVGAILVTMSVRLAGGNQVIPISFNVNVP